ncbi:MAG: endonuclease [Bacteroidales bacterium]|nr:endonuclease [Bacteroidales bacterium]
MKNLIILIFILGGLCITNAQKPTNKPKALEKQGIYTKPGNSKVSSPKTSSSATGCTDVQLLLTTDSYGWETSWELKNSNGSTLYSGKNLDNNASYNVTFCLSDGNYNFVIYDAYNDGICCSYGNGSYSLTKSGQTIASGANFGASESTPFVINSTVNTCTNTLATLTLVTDEYGSEVSWTLKNSHGNTVYSGGDYGNHTTYTEEFCLVDGDYTFTINDSYGDGICCLNGYGSYTFTSGKNTLASGGEFTSTESTKFSINGNDKYYESANGKTGYSLKSALHNIIKNHTSKGYKAIWSFVKDNDLDNYYEQDSTVLDIYSENSLAADPYNFTPVTNQCGNARQEGDCYSREHSFPKSWFGGKKEPMNSDIHHIFPVDQYVNSKRDNFPYGIVGSESYTSYNGSKRGTALSSTGYDGIVFEPIDEFKGDVARAHLYMATRYENVIASWESLAPGGNEILNGTSDGVFEDWALDVLLLWHEKDPVSQKEIDRNNAAHAYQGNRNPFVDHPEFAHSIWGYSSLKNALNNDSEPQLNISYFNDNLQINSSEAIKSVSVVSMSGKVIFTSSKITEAKPLNLQPGVYAVIVHTNTQSKQSIIIVQ